MIWYCIFDKLAVYLCTFGSLGRICVFTSLRSIPSAFNTTLRCMNTDKTEYWQNNLARSVAFFIAVTAQLHWMPKACLRINFVLSVYWEYIGLGELFLNYVNYWHPLMRLRLRRQIWNSNRLSRLQTNLVKSGGEKTKSTEFCEIFEKTNSFYHIWKYASNEKHIYVKGKWLVVIEENNPQLSWSARGTQQGLTQTCKGWYSTQHCKGGTHWLPIFCPDIRVKSKSNHECLGKTRGNSFHQLQWKLCSRVHEKNMRKSMVFWRPSLGPMLLILSSLLLFLE